MNKINFFFAFFLSLISNLAHSQPYAVRDEVNFLYYNIPHAKEDLDTAYQELRLAKKSAKNKPTERIAYVGHSYKTCFGAKIS